MCSRRYISRQAHPFNVGTAGAADSELKTKLVLTAQGTAVLYVAFDMPVTVLQQPGPDVAVKEIEPGGRQRTADIAAAARFGGEVADFIGRDGSRTEGARDEEKRSGNNTLHRGNLARPQPTGQRIGPRPD